MKELTKIEINKVPYYVKYGTMSMIAFGKLTGLPVKEVNNLPNMQFEQLYQLYYSGLVAGCQIQKVPCLTWEEFLLAVEEDETILDTLQSLKKENSTVEGN